MGIKFDILTDKCLLFETSEFSRFFTNSEPIKTIHNELKVAHDTKLVLSPTDNRHVLWDALRDGKAIFASINKPKVIKSAKMNLITALKALPVPPNLGRSYNEIKFNLKRIMDMVESGPVTSLDFRKIEKKINGTGDIKEGKTIKQLVHELYPEDETLRTAIDEFVTAIRPGNYVLVKRLPQKSRNAAPYMDPYEKPSERKFVVREPTNKKDKIFSQEYTAWFFDGDKLVNKKQYSRNAVTVYRDLFSGWGDRDFYVVEDENFLRLGKHPFIPTKDVSFVEIIPLEGSSIKYFTQDVFAKYERLITNKIKETTEKMKQKVIGNMGELNTPGEDITASIAEYRDALNTINKGVKHIDAEMIFKQFLLLDTKLNLDRYLLINADRPFKKYTPYSITAPVEQSREEWEILNKNEILDSIRNFAKSSVSSSRQRMAVKVRPKSHREDVINVNFDEFRTKPDANQYEMWDFDRRRWVPFDPKYIETFEFARNASTHTAIAFRNLREYNEFVRRFIIFAMRTIVKTPEIKEFENIVQDL